MANRLDRVRKRAKRKGISYNLTKGWWDAQINMGVCSVTGIKFNTRESDTTINPHYPSIDRIDSSKGYTKDNCQFVVFIYNVLKADNKEADIKLFAEKFIETYEKENI